MMVKFEDKVVYHYVSILLYPNDSLRCINPKVVELCHFQIIKFKNPWLLRSRTGEKQRVVAKIENCPVEVEG